MRLKTLFLLLPLVVCRSLLAQEEQSFLHYQISLPQGFQLIDKSPRMMDFSIYEIQNSKRKSVARIYAGNHPSTKLKAPISVGDSTVSVKHLTEASLSSKDYEALLVFEGLYYKSDEGSPWTCLHLFGITSNQKVRTAIIDAFKNIKVTKPRID